MKTLGVGVVVGLVVLASAGAQQDESAAQLRVTSRAVLVDVIVTDSAGKPITGIPKSAFTLTEDGKPQTVSFFEEHGDTPIVQTELRKLPTDEFTNFSPFPQPSALNVLLLDTLNTRMESQSIVHTQAMKFLNSAKPGARSAIFAMGMSLHFIQGFSDDPSVLAAALSNKKNLYIENSVMLKSQAQSNAEEWIAALAPGLASLFAEMDSFNEDQRKMITLANLQRLAAFLNSFPGRKNIIWFSERPPGLFNSDGSTGNPAIGDEVKKTIAMFAAARVALYPVDARGTSVYADYTAENNPLNQSTTGESIRKQAGERNGDQENAKILAEQTGGRAYANTNGFSEVLEKVMTDSAHFYTLSYSPSDTKMDGSFRKIVVKVSGEKYNLMYRRGYYAVDVGATSPKLHHRKKAPQAATSDSPEASPLAPFMDLGMPESQQISYKVRVLPSGSPATHTADLKNKLSYSVDFAIDPKDLELKTGLSGEHRGVLQICMIVYDRNRSIISREEHLAQLNIKADAYAMLQNAGVQLHWNFSLPNGNYWLRTGIYDPASKRIGTLEIPLSQVRKVDTAMN